MLYRCVRGGSTSIPAGSKAIHHPTTTGGAVVAFQVTAVEELLGNNVRDRESPPAYLLTALRLLFLFLSFSFSSSSSFTAIVLAAATRTHAHTRSLCAKGRKPRTFLTSKHLAGRLASHIRYENIRNGRNPGQQQRHHH